TIFLGLPLGRMRRPRHSLKAFLNAASAGILLFLLFEILDHAFGPVEARVEAARTGAGSWAGVPGFVLLFAAGLAAGLMSLLYLGKWQRSRRARVGTPGPGPTQSVGPGAMATAEPVSESTRTALELLMSI